MPGKCEHGLTTRECYVCASPKYGAHKPDPTLEVAVRHAQELDRLRVAALRLVTLEDAVRYVVDRHGGVRAAERATGVDKSFISRLMNGHKVAPSVETLRALGLRAVPLYEVLK